MSTLEAVEPAPSVPASVRTPTAASALRRAGVRAACAARTIRNLPRAALSADPHRVSRRALASDRVGLALCGLFRGLVYPHAGDGGTRLPVGAGEPRTLQDAPHLLWRCSRAICRLGHAPVPAGG